MTRYDTIDTFTTFHMATTRFIRPALHPPFPSPRTYAQLRAPVFTPSVLMTNRSRRNLQSKVLAGCTAKGYRKSPDLPN